MPKNILEYSADDIIRLVRRDAEEHLIKSPPATGGVSAQLRAETVKADRPGEQDSLRITVVAWRVDGTP